MRVQAELLSRSTGELSSRRAAMEWHMIMALPGASETLAEWRWGAMRLCLQPQQELQTALLRLRSACSAADSMTCSDDY